MINPQSRRADDILMTSELDTCGSVVTRNLNPFD